METAADYSFPSTIRIWSLRFCHQTLSRSVYSNVSALLCYGYWGERVAGNSARVLSALHNSRHQVRAMGDQMLETKVSSLSR
jgi:hypothetical protein